MRQVPFYLIIGSGRVASHLSHYFSLINLPYSTWSRQQNSEQDLAALTKTASHVLLAIKDMAIADFVAHHPFLAAKTLVHFSGCLALPAIHSAHPLTSFAESFYELSEYQNVAFILEKDAPEFSDLLPGLPNPHYKIPASLKPYYHALCVMSGNFTALLWQKFFSELENRFHLPKEIALPYLKQVTQNLINNPAQALTGPLVRGDKKTITANLESLENDSFKSIYEAFVTVFNHSKESKSKEPMAV